MALFPLSESYPHLFGAQAKYPKAASFTVQAVFFALVALPLVVVSAIAWLRLALVLLTVMPIGGFGLDLARQRLRAAIVRAAVVSLAATLIFNAVYEFVLRPRSDTTSSDVTVFVTVFLGVTFFVILMSLRLCAGREIRKEFERGTARFDPEEARRTRSLKEQFWRRIGRSVD